MLVMLVREKSQLDSFVRGLPDCLCGITSLPKYKVD